MVRRVRHTLQARQETAVAGLPSDELDSFKRWFEEYIADEWDQRIEQDVSAGKLGAAGRKADAEFEEGRCTPLCSISHRRNFGIATAIFRRRCVSWPTRILS
jgi:hypothetical protein